MSIRNVIFIDSGISDPAPLISSIPADSLWFVLEDNRDGLQQMADKLAGLTGLSSIQIVSHGAAGLLYLGSGTLGLGNLIPATPLLTRIGASLASGGDLLLYGCDVAQGSEGQKFVEQLAALTGANVAASADLSGPVGLGGNSVLEVATGSIESASLDLSRMKETLGAVVASNGHYYEVVNTPVTWTEALNAAAQKTYNGLTGYLVTITSTDEQTFLTNLVANNVTTGWDGKSAWIAASDANSEGSWKWVAGPEAGQLFWNGNQTGSAAAGNFNAWKKEYLQNESSASGISGTWTNSTGTGSDFAFLDANYTTSANWDDAYSSLTATSTSASPIASSAGMRNAYVVEYSDLTPPTISITSSASSLVNGQSATINFTLSEASTNFTSSGVAVSGGTLSNFSGSGTNYTATFTANTSGTQVGKVSVGSRMFSDLADNPNTDGDEANNVVTFAFPALPVTTSLFNGHYYEVINSAVTWQQARDLAAASTCAGQHGHLVTITSVAEQEFIYNLARTQVTVGYDGASVWLGASDAETEGQWQWVVGPETGTFFWSGRSNGTALSGAYANWLPSTAEPNNDDGSGTDSDYVFANLSPSATFGLGRWVDHTGTISNAFVIEYENAHPTGSVNITGTPMQGQQLGITQTLTDPNGIGDFSYQWQADGVDISGATGSSLTLRQTQVGKAITVRVSYTDGYGNAESVTSAATAAVANINDAPTGTVSITGTAAQGQTLSASNALADIDGLGTIAYQWLSDGVNIAGANASTYKLSQADVGHKISVAASYVDAGGASERVVSAETSVVANFNDLPTGALTLSGAYVRGQTLSVNNNLADLDGLGAITYQWQANGADISGATGSSFTLTSAQVGKTISVKASYTDGQGTQEVVHSGLFGEAAVGSYATFGGDLYVFNGGDKNITYTVAFSLAGLSSFVLWNQGDGTLGAYGISKPNDWFGSSATLVGAADLNGDGRPDIIGRDANNQIVSFLLASNWTPYDLSSLHAYLPTPVASGVTGTYLSAANIDADAYKDLLLKTAQGLRIVWGNGNGTFLDEGRTLALGYAAGSVLSADFNKDGRTDLAISSESTSVMEVYLGDGSGNFSKSFGLTSSTTYNIATGDLNADGNPDLIVNGLVYRGNGAGNFTAGTQITVPAGRSVVSSLVADMNGDGKQDVVLGLDQGIVVALGDGAGGFGSQETLALNSTATPASLASADFNGDGRTDLVASAPLNSTTIFLNTNGVQNHVVIDANHLPNGGVSIGGLSSTSVLNMGFEGANGAYNFGSSTTNIGSPLISTAQKNSGASSIYLGGNGAALKITNAALNLGSADFGFDFYMKTDGAQNFYSVLFSSYAEGGWGEIGNGTGAGAFHFYDGASISGLNINDGNWHHVVAGQTGNQAYLVIDNTLQGQATSTATSHNFNDLLLGKLGGMWIGNSDNSFKGWIDDLKIYTVQAPQQGQTLTATNTLTDSDGLGTITYQWKLDGTTISGATGSNYTLTQADVGHQISVTASYTDLVGTKESVTSLGTAAVVNTNDMPTGMVAISGTTKQGQVLTAGNTLADLDGLGTISYQWKLDGNAIVGATAASYMLKSSDVGHKVSVTASYTDGFGTSESVTSALTATITADNVAPTGSVDITGAGTSTRALAASDITNAATQKFNAANGHIYEYIDQALTWQNAYTMASARTIKGVSGYLTTITSQAEQSFILSNDPTATGRWIGASDAATEGVWKWMSGPELGQTLTYTNWANGEPNNSEGAENYAHYWKTTGLWNDAANSGIVTGSNPSGNLTGFVVEYSDNVSTYQPPQQGTTLTATNTLSDANGLGTITYQWRSDGMAIINATSSTYTLTQADVGHKISVTAAYTDGLGSNESVTSLATTDVLNVNDIPTGNLMISGNAAQGQTLSVINTLVDLDGIGTISYQWKIDGNAIVGATNAIYTLKSSDVGHRVSVTASYTDNFGALESVTSSLTQLVTVATAPSGLSGVSYFWNYESTKGHALLSGVNVTGQVDSTPSASPVLLKNVIWDANGHVTAEVWLHATTIVTSYDIDLLLAQATGSATFTPAAGAPSGFLPISYFDTNTHHLKASGAGLTGYAAGDFKLADVSFDVGVSATAVAISMASDRVNTLTGDAFDIVMTKAITGSNGAYAFDALPSGTYREQASRTSADGASAVNSLDALAALKMAVSLNPNTDPDGAGAQAAPATSAYQYIAADVAGNSGNTPDGKVTAADALAILKMAVGMPSAPTANWVLLAESTNLSALSKDNVAWDNSATTTVSSGSASPLNFVGVIKGDVNGSWAAPTGSQYLETADPTHFATLAQSLSVPSSQWQIV